MLAALVAAAYPGRAGPRQTAQMPGRPAGSGGQMVVRRRMVNQAPAAVVDPGMGRW